MRSIITLSLFVLMAIPAAQAQLKVEVIPAGGYPIMLSGKNIKDYGLVIARLQVSYKEESAIWAPYIAASVSSMELPLYNKEINTLSLPVLSASFKVGLSGVIKNNEERRSSWAIGGGIGLHMLRPDEATLWMNGQETYLSYTTLKDKAWFPEIEAGIRWTRYAKQELGWYFGVQAFVASIWLRDSGVRYNTVISGTSYNLNFRGVALLPSIGGIIGYNF